MAQQVMSFCPSIGFRKIKRCQADLKLQRFRLIHLRIYTHHAHTHMQRASAAAVMDGWDILLGRFGPPKGECCNLKDGYVHSFSLLVPPFCPANAVTLL